MLPVTRRGSWSAGFDSDLKGLPPPMRPPWRRTNCFYLLSKVKIKEIMTQNPVTVPPDHTVEENG